MAKTNRIDVRIFIFLLTFATLLLFVISPDSYTHELFVRTDSACFFTAGKAWMNGMVPYVDFADSKGPLLWLIYGIGYLISHTDYTGVFWISCLWYGATYYITYLTAQLLLNDKRKAFVSTIFMSLAFFMYFIHYEIRAEDFCLPFVILSIYADCRLLYGGNTTNKTTIKQFYTLGICFAALLMMKFSVAAMQGIFILYALYFLVRERKSFITPLASFTAGVLTITLPFVVYFMIAGNFEAFIQEYFFNTMMTVKPKESFPTSYIQEFTKSTFKYHFIPLFILIMIIIGGTTYRKGLQKYKWFPLLTGLFIYALCVIQGHSYYFCIPATCLLFFVLTVMRHVRLRFRGATMIFSVLIIFALTVLLSQTDRQQYHNFTWSSNQYRKDFHNAANLMSQVKNSTFIVMHSCGVGLETPAEALPACKYWIYQKGATPEMIRDQQEAIRHQKPDFIYAKSDQDLKVGNITVETLDSLGYHLCYQFKNPIGNKVSLFTKHPLN